MSFQPFTEDIVHIKNSCRREAVFWGEHTECVFRVEELRQSLTLKSCFFSRLRIGVHFDMILECYFLRHNIAHRMQHWHSSKTLLELILRLS